MKKFIASFIVMSFLAFALPLTAEAQKRCYKPRKSKVSRNYVNRNYNRSYNRNNRSYQTRGYTYQRQSFYRRHRNLINVGAATGGGALLGGLIGGNRRSMGAGALIGAGAGALYTYVLKPKRRR
jgi:hypothetical protein